MSVPVGEDQLPHIELTREIARRFNRQFKDVFPEPEALVGRVPRLVGTDGHPVFLYHDAFNPNRDEVADLRDRYRRGAVGDVEVKQRLAAAFNALLDPIRERRARYEANMAMVRDVLAEGTDRARRTAQATMALVRDTLDLGYLEKFRGH